MKSGVLDVLSQNIFHLTFSVIAAVLNFLPLMMGIDSQIEESRLAYSSAGAAYEGFNLFFLGLLSPLVVDVTLDVISSARQFMKTFMIEKAEKGSSDTKGAKKLSLVGNTMNMGETVVMMMGMILLPVCTLLPSSTPNGVLLTMCGRRAVNALVSGAFASSLARYFEGSKRTTASLVVLTGIAFICIGGITSTLALNYKGAYLEPRLFICGIIFTYGAVLIALAISVYWLVTEAYPEEVKKFLKSMFACITRSSATHPEPIQLPPANGQAKHGLYNQCRVVYFRTVHVMSFIFFVVLSCGMAASFRSIKNATEFELILLSVPLLVWALLISARSMRQVKLAAFENLVALLDAKKQYVRYISHEIRTPLNSAFLGLKFLLEQFKDSEDSRDADTYETLLDVNVSCLTAIDVLNDLLCFDKLESGILHLHTTEEAVLPFLGSCVSMFAAQAREKEVELKTVTKHDTNESPSIQERPGLMKRLSVRLASVHLLSASVRSQSGKETNKHTILPSDVVHMDKFKMDQVIRNLISNALKFSPRGGTVTVEAWFEKTNEQRPPSETVSKRRKSSIVLPPRVARLFSMQSSTSALRVGIEKGKEDHAKDAKASSSIYGRLVVAVTDEGAGISPENQKRLFKEVVQFNPEKLQAGGGSGFGLFITKGIVDLHNGNISVYSKGEGHGCTFTVSIPMERDVKAASAASGTAGQHRSEDSSAVGGGSGIRLDVEAAIEMREPLRTAEACAQRTGDHNVFSSDGDGNGNGNGNGNDKQENTSIDRVSNGRSMLNALSKQEANRLQRGVSSSRQLLSSPSPKKADSSPRVSMSLQISQHTMFNNAGVTANNIAGGARIGVINGGRNGIEKPNSSGYHLLVVDDSHLNRKMLCKLLRAAGHTCEEADDGDTAIEKVKAIMQTGAGDGATRHEYDCILMDYVMPRLEGPKAAQQIRSMGYEGRIVGLTGNGLQSDIDHYIAHGANQVFVKPLDIDSFQAYMSANVEIAE